MSDSPLDELDLGEVKVRKKEFPDDCSIEMRRFFILIGSAAVMILIGAYWYTQYQAKGVTFRPFSTVLNSPQANTATAGAQLANWVMPSPVVSPNDVPNLAGVQMHAPGAGHGNGMVNQQASARPMAAPAQSFNQFTTNSLPMAQNGMRPVVARPALPSMAAPMSARPMLVKGQFTNVIADITNSVVHVGVKTNGSINQNGTGPGRSGVRFANPINPNPSMGQAGDLIGSGVIVSANGYIITNYHVVRDAAEVQVTVFGMQGSRNYRADVVRMDERADLALLKITPAERLVVAPLGQSSRIRVGDDVIAIGSPFGLGQTVSKGIISAVRKSMVIEGMRHEGLLQTDAAINQGNSGGPLFNDRGQVIGINTAIYTPTGSFAGIGFAVPSDTVRNFAQQDVRDMASINKPNGNMILRVAGTAVGNAGPPIRAGVPSPHRDGRERMNCASCHELLTANGTSMAVRGFQLQTPTFRGALQPVAAQGMQAAPQIKPNVTPPATHNDGRNQMNCASCHQFTTAAATRPVAATSSGLGAMTGVFGNMMMQQAAAPAANNPPAPPISANATPPGSHSDGRNQMNCASCHQIQGGAAGAANQLDAAMNGNGNPFANGKRVHALPGADVQLIDELVAKRLNQAIGKGVFVTNVHTGSPAEQAGLVAGDIILKMDGRRVRSPSSLARWVGKLHAGDEVRLTVLHSGLRERLILVIDNNDWRAVAKQQQTAAVAPPMVKKRPIPTEFTWFGMEIESFTPRTSVIRGAKVGDVTAGSAAAKGGVKSNDIIVEVNGLPVANAATLDRAIRGASKNKDNMLRMMRRGREFYLFL